MKLKIIIRFINVYFAYIVKDIFVIFYYDIFDFEDSVLSNLDVNIHYLCTWKDIISVIDMQNENKISKDRIQGYKRGVKNKLEIKETDDLDDFWNSILIPTLSNRHSVNPVHSLKDIKKLKRVFNTNIKQFNVYHEDQLVAGTTIFLTKNVAHVQYIGSNSEKNSLGSLDFLFYNLITEYLSDFKYFDFGNSHEQQGMKINKGLNYWKEGYGARSLTHDFYEIKISNFHKLNNVMI